MKTFQWSCCERIDSPDHNHGEITVIEGLVTPPTTAESRGDALSKLHQWFMDNKCRPYREVG